MSSRFPLQLGFHASPTKSEVPICVSDEDRFQHIHVIGQTGTGKSTLTQNAILQDIFKGEGVCLIDPHGTDAEYVLNRIPENRMRDVIYFNPADHRYPVTFNIFENVNPRQHNKVTDLIVDALHGLWWNSWGARMDDILRCATYSHLEIPKKNYSTLLGIPFMLTNPLYREWLVKHTRNQATKEFWNSEFENWSSQKRNDYIQPVMNKVRRFTQSDTLRNVIGYPKSTLNLRYIMNNQKILIANLNTGKIGATDANILGSLLITAIDFIARERELGEDEKDPVPFHVFIDEFQSFTTSNFTKALSELRKHKISFFLAHQYLDQIDGKVMAALHGNVGTTVAFRVGGSDAQNLSAILDWDQDAIASQSDYECLVRVKTDHSVNTHHTITRVLPFKRMPYMKSIVRRTQNDYAYPRAYIDQKQQQFYNNPRWASVN